MCGRYSLTTDDYETVAETFGALMHPDDAAAYRPRYNAAPHDTCWVVTLETIRGEASRWIGAATWGFAVPGHKEVINARSETVHRRPSFAEAFWTGRCGLAADGFFEWTGPRGERQPLWFHRADGAPFLMAAIYQDRLDADGRSHRHFAVLTTEPNELVAPHHDRMPVILPPGRVDQWLRPPAQRGSEAIERAHTLFAPPPRDWLVATPVDRRVSDVRNDDPSCLDPVPWPGNEGQGTLF